MSQIASLGTFAMDIEKLPRDTRRIWERLRQEPLLNGFILIGGTALTGIRPLYCRDAFIFQSGS